jgi:thiol-disulfide isomerase/thioredoxin
MRSSYVSLALTCVLVPAWALAQEKSEGPANEKAQKSYNEGMKSLTEHREQAALESFKKADKQDSGHCLACQKKMMRYAVDLGDWKTAESASEEMLTEAHGERETAMAHYQYAVVLFQEGMQKHKDEYFARAHEEILKALTAYSNFPDALFVDGRALAYLKQDDPAKARFQEFVKAKSGDDVDRQRALRYINRPELARAKMAPPFMVTTIDGKRIAMDDLQGKVVLLDFWATWCEPCREALPHIRDVAKKFQGQPLVILSVSLDSDEQKWKEYIGKNEMTWPQYRDGGFSGPVAKLFFVTEIPHTFTIDSDGVLQEEHVGDASIEGKLKKLLAHARELQPAEATAK